MRLVFFFLQSSKTDSLSMILQRIKKNRLVIRRLCTFLSGKKTERIAITEGLNVDECEWPENDDGVPGKQTRHKIQFSFSKYRNLVYTKIADSVERAR